MSRHFHRQASILIIAALAAAPACAADEAAVGGTQSRYITGGIGETSAARIAELAADFNLKLLFAAKDGHYVADVAIAISDARGERVLEAVSEGPFLLAKLAPGRYQIRASYEGVAFTRATTIPASGRREVIFRWDERLE